jgi:hypothetical protein
MTHQIKIYQSDPKAFESAPTGLFVLNGLSLILGVIGTIFFCHNFGAIGWLSLLLPVISFGLYFTNERLGMSLVEAEFWKKYRSLDEQTQRRIPLTPRLVRDMPAGDEWDALVSSINKLVKTRDERVEIEARSRGEFVDAREAIKHEYEVEKQLLEEAKEVHKELVSRQLI